MTKIEPEKVITKLYQCVFCEKTFTRRSWYDKHDCAKKKRFSESNNLVTIKAQQLFAFWQRRTGIKRRIKLSPMTEFLESPFYKTFKRLSEFTQKTYVISAFKYLEWLIRKGIPDRNWTNPKNLSEFRESMRDSESVAEQVDLSFRHIRAWCTENGNLPVTEFFSKIVPLHALMMVRENKLLPWVLLGFDLSVDKLVNRFPQEHILALDEFINLEYWLTKIEEHPDKKALAQTLSQSNHDAPA